ncbi:CHAD domain-containing protein [Jhaorihella thermophila]|uniref:CHAD domain-containing protein n=2 Tax=Jhaorihella thermophila TaxID=488547 RepID=A0A1H5ULS0_9RHOB|nr:CHAD domain-containing protein [Jhaorihella thermophila]
MPKDAPHMPNVRDVLSGFLRDAQQARRVLMTSTVPEGPHQLRVALRKLRTALGIFGKDDPQARALRDEARLLGRRIGELRDLDVVAVEIIAPERHADPADSGLWTLEVALSEARIAARKALREYLAHGEGGKVLDRWAALLGSDADFLDRPAGEAADKALKRRVRKAGRLGRRFHKLDDAHRHEFRKEIKKLRYTLDCGAWDAGGPARVKFRKRLKRLQNALGAMNDAVVAREVLDRICKDMPEDSPAHAVGRRLVRRLEKQARHDRRQVESLWKKVAETRLPA